MRIGITTLAALLGVAVVVALAPLVPVTVALALGAAAAVPVVWRGRSRQYAVAGTLFTLGVGACILYVPRFSGEWTRTPLVALVVFGGSSATVLVVRWLAGFVGRRVVGAFVHPDSAEGVWNALAAFGSLLVITWSVLTAHEKALRTGGITVVGGGAMLADTFGYEFPVGVPFVRQGIAFTVAGYDVLIPAWLVANGVDAPMVLFVGCVLVGFYTLDTVSATWFALRSTGRRAAEAGSDSGAEPGSRPAGAGAGSGSGPGPGSDGTAMAPSGTEADTVDHGGESSTTSTPEAGTATDSGTTTESGTDPDRSSDGDPSGGDGTTSGGDVPDDDLGSIPDSRNSGTGDGS